MSKDEIRYERGQLQLVWRSAPYRVAVAALREVNRCVLADPVLHADEHFHLLRLRERFWIVGPFVPGAAQALAALREQALVPQVRLTVQRVPWLMRAPGLLGVRLWPIAGFGLHPNAALPSLGIHADERAHTWSTRSEW